MSRDAFTELGDRASLSAALNISCVAVAWGAVSGTLAVVVGLRANSTALAGTGAGILADLVSSATLIWRFRAEQIGTSPPASAERFAHRVSSSALLLVSLGLLAAGIERLVSGEAADPSAAAISLAAVSLVALPLLAARKYRIAAEVQSSALRMDAHITLVGASTAALALLGLIATASLGWSSADPIAALLIAAVAGRIGAGGLREAQRSPR